MSLANILLVEVFQIVFFYQNFAMGIYKKYYRIIHELSFFFRAKWPTFKFQVDERAKLHFWERKGFNVK